MVVLRVFVPFAIAYFLSYLFRTINAVIAPDLVRDVGLDAALLGLLTSTYFLTFAAFQLPLGILLDRFGPRRTEASLLVIAAVGALVFAVSSNATGLILGRALIGLGVSACLMGALKAYVIWFPGVRLATVNGLHLAVGSMGAMTATAPVEAVLQLTDWRGVFLGLAVLTGAAALLLFLVVPEREGGASGDTLKEQIKGTLAVVSHPFFLRIAPLALTAQGTFLAFPDPVGRALAPRRGRPRSDWGGQHAAADRASHAGRGSSSWAGPPSASKRWASIPSSCPPSA